MSPEPASAGNRLPGLYLTVVIGAESFGVPLGRIEEVVGLKQVTPVLQPPDYAAGFVTLCGRVIPVADLRANFGVRAALTAATRLVVVGFERDSQPRELLALVVDRVGSAVTFTDADIEPASVYGPGVDTGFLLGVGKAGRRRQPLLNLDGLFDRDHAAVGLTTPDA